MTYRVTNNMMQNLLISDMHSNLAKLLDIQQQLSTQRRYQSATQDPNAVTKGMGLETMMLETEQYRDNLLDAVSWLKFTDTALGDMNDIFHRVRELAIYAGDGVLEGVDREAIALELEELKEQLRVLANSTIAGEHLFAGLKTDTTPFTIGPRGEVVYNGNEYAVKWEFGRREVGKVSITGAELFPKDEITNDLVGIEVSTDFAWTGRNEILEFKVGWQTVKVRIPEKWQDENVNGLDDYGDYNRFREPGELEGWSLKEIADMINASTEMGDVSKILKAEVITDTDRGVQQLVIKSHTGEPVRLTSWPETDPVWVAQGIKGAAYGAIGRVADADGMLVVKFSDGIMHEVPVAKGESLADIAGRLNALPDAKLWAAVKQDGKNEWLDIVARETAEDIYFDLDATGGATALFTPQIVQARSMKSGAFQNVDSRTFYDGDKDEAKFKTHAAGTLTIEVDSKRYTAEIDKGKGLADLDGLDNTKFTDVDGNMLSADFEFSVAVPDGVFTVSRADHPKETYTVIATGGLAPLYSDGAIARSTTTADKSGKYTLTTTPVPNEVGSEFMIDGDGSLMIEYAGKIYTMQLEKGKTYEETVDALRTFANDKGIDITAEIIEGIDDKGTPTVSLKITSGSELSISGFGSGASFIGSHFTGSKEIQTNTDHSHIGFAEYMGLETAIKSTEMAIDGDGWDTTADPLHIKFVSGSNRGEVYIADSDHLSLEELANRINGVCGSWLEAIVETDEPDGTDPFGDPLDNNEQNREDATKRLVIRSLTADAIAIYDGPGMDVAKKGAVGSYAEMLGISTALRGESTAAAPADTQDRNVKYPDRAADSFFDENMPAIIEVTVGTKVFECKVCNKNCPTAEKVAAAIVRQVNEQYGGTLLAWDANDIANDPGVTTNTFALFAVTGEPLRVIDRGYGDPRYTEFSGGVAMQLGIAAGITSVADKIKDDDTFCTDTSTIRIIAPGRSVDVPILKDDTLRSIADRVRDYAGDWLDVSFYDSTVGPIDDGTGTVRMSLAAKDGSAVSVIDLNFDGKTDGDIVNGVAHQLELDTGLTGTADLSGVKFPKFVEGNTLTIDINGMSHTIDLYDNEIVDPAHRLPAESIEDLADLINARFQGQDLIAEVYQPAKDGPKYLTLVSPKGYTFELKSEGQVDVNGTATDVREALGFKDGVNSTSRGYDPADKASSGDRTGANYNQNVTRRTGNNVKKTDFFGVVDNLIDCVRGGHVDGISDSMITQLDDWLSTLLQCRAQAGALQSRYQTASYRMQSNNTNYTELHNNTVGIDLAEVITNYQMASNIYEASLAALARIIQPTLLDFLS